MKWCDTVAGGSHWLLLLPQDGGFPFQSETGSRGIKPDEMESKHTLP